VKRERQRDEGGEQVNKESLSRRDFLKAGGAGLVGAALLGAAGCGRGETDGGQGGGGGLVDRADIRIEFVTHGPAADPFWSVIKTGVDRAAADLGVDVKYRPPERFDIPQIQRNFEAAIASEPSAMAVTIADPEALVPLVKEAVGQDIPVVALNAGLDVWEEAGALNYVGQTEFEAGVEAGKRMADEGVSSALCINQQQGVQTLDQRCAGFAEGLGGNVEEVAVEGDDPTAAQSAIETALGQNPDVDGLLTLGPQGSDPALKALTESGRAGDIVFGTFDLSPEILQAVRDGKMAFAIDQQPFLQGYMPVAILADYVQYLLHPVGVIPTGPNFVIKQDAQAVIDLSKEGIR
jgi:simple sugar transport system substrate-binding protein